MKEKLNISTNLALLLLGVFCQTEMLRRTLGFSVQPHFYYCLILLCIGLWYTAHGRRLNGIGILASLLILCLVFRIGRSDILPQLTDFFGRIGNLVSERFLLNADSYPYSPEASGYSLLFLTLAFLEAAYLSIALSSRGARTDLALLGTLPFSVFCVAVSDSSSPSFTWYAPFLVSYRDRWQLFQKRIRQQHRCPDGFIASRGFTCHPPSDCKPAKL